MYEALNAMGETAWGINPSILEQVQVAYKELKGGFCGLPLHDSVDSAPLPTPPSKVFRTEVSNGQLTAQVSTAVAVLTLHLFTPLVHALHRLPGCYSEVWEVWEQGLVLCLAFTVPGTAGVTAYIMSHTCAKHCWH